MRASELIIKLQKIIEESGDLPVIYWNETEESLCQVSINEVSIFKDRFKGNEIELT